MFVLYDFLINKNIRNTKYVMICNFAVMALKIIKILTTVCILGIGIPALAQGPPPDPGPPPPQGLVVPVDENIFILVVVGVLYGIYVSFRQKRKVTH